MLHGFVLAMCVEEKRMHTIIIGDMSFLYIKHVTW